MRGFNPHRRLYVLSGSWNSRGPFLFTRPLRRLESLAWKGIGLDSPPAYTNGANMTAAFFIDLPNFYSRLLNSKMAELKVMKEYFLQWLDFDLLAGSLEPSFSGIWIFYSGTRFGPSRAISILVYDKT